MDIYPEQLVPYNSCLVELYQKESQSKSSANTLQQADNGLEYSPNSEPFRSIQELLRRLSLHQSHSKKTPLLLDKLLRCHYLPPSQKYGLM